MLEIKPRWQRLQRDCNPWPPWCQCDALLTELSYEASAEAGQVQVQFIAVSCIRRGFIAQSVQHRTSIAKSWVWIALQPRNFLCKLLHMWRSFSLIFFYISTLHSLHINIHNYYCKTEDLWLCKIIYCLLIPQVISYWACSFNSISNSSCFMLPQKISDISLHWGPIINY